MSNSTKKWCCTPNFVKGDLVIFIEPLSKHFKKYINSVGIVLGVNNEFVKVLFTETVVGTQIIIVNKKNLKKVNNNT